MIEAHPAVWALLGALTCRGHRQDLVPVHPCVDARGPVGTDQARVASNPDEPLQDHAFVEADENDVSATGRT